MTDEALEPEEREDTQPLPRGVAPVVVPRWVQLVTLPLAIVAIWIIAKAAGVVLLVFVVAAVVALILNPLVAFLQRRARFPRALAVATVYVGLLVTLITVGFLLADPIASQAQKLSNDVPRLVDSANQTLDDLQGTLDDKGINIEVKRQGETALQTLQGDSLQKRMVGIQKRLDHVVFGVAETRVVEVVWPKVANSDNHSCDVHVGLSGRMKNQAAPMLDSG